MKKARELGISRARFTTCVKEHEARVLESESTHSAKTRPMRFWECSAVYYALLDM